MTPGRVNLGPNSTMAQSVECPWMLCEGPPETHVEVWLGYSNNGTWKVEERLHMKDGVWKHNTHLATRYYGDDLEKAKRSVRRVKRASLAGDGYPVVVRSLYIFFTESGEEVL